MTLEKHLNRKEQAAYLLERGLKISPSALAKKAVNGTGPEYFIFLKEAVSTPTLLDRWAESILAKPRRSTSEAAPITPSRATRSTIATKASRSRSSATPLRRLSREEVD